MADTHGKESFLDRAYASTSVDGTRSLYDEWASTYDQEITSPKHDYIAPPLAASILIELLAKYQQDGDSPLSILDAGCGTGLVGTSLIKASKSSKPPLNIKIDGIDLSTGMLDLARKTNAYSSLSVADLSQPLTHPSSTYSATICIGVLTEGHVGPSIIPSFVRVTKQHGYVVATIKQVIWESGGYKETIDDLVQESKVEVVSCKPELIVKGDGVWAMVVVLQLL